MPSLIVLRVNAKIKIAFIWVLMSCFILSSIIVPQPVLAQSVNDLPVPGTMVNLSPAYAPVLLKGLKVNPQNPFKFEFIVDQGSDVSAQIKTESNKLIKYFLAAMTVPEKDLWVNLSPYEKNRMIADNLGQTEMGRDMLAQDYILKQLTASLIYPEKELGKIFWDKVYAKSRELYGTTEVPVNTFNKVWIVADKADVFERGNVAYVVGAHLKVMMEEDYLAKSKNMNHSKTSLSSQVLREVIIPEIEREVNTGKNFAPLRQMYYSMIIASWYKMSIKDAILNQIYSNKNKTSTLNAYPLTLTPEQIYQKYLQAYKKGVFNYIKDDFNQVTQQPVPRKYFSGGLNIDAAQVISRQTILSDPSQIANHAFIVSANASLKASAAMTTSIDELNLTPNSTNKLKGAGINTLEDIQGKTYREIVGIVTAGGAEVIRKKLAQRIMYFKVETKKEPLTADSDIDKLHLGKMIATKLVLFRILKVQDLMARQYSEVHIQDESLEVIRKQLMYYGFYFKNSHTKIKGFEQATVEAVLTEHFHWDSLNKKEVEGLKRIFFKKLVQYSEIQLRAYGFTYAQVQMIREILQAHNAYLKWEDPDEFKALRELGFDGILAHRLQKHFKDKPVTIKALSELKSAQVAGISIGLVSINDIREILRMHGKYFKDEQSPASQAMVSTVEVGNQYFYTIRLENGSLRLVLNSEGMTYENAHNKAKRLTRSIVSAISDELQKWYSMSKESGQFHKQLQEYRKLPDDIKIESVANLWGKCFALNSINVMLGLTRKSVIRLSDVLDDAPKNLETLQELVKAVNLLPVNELKANDPYPRALVYYVLVDLLGVHVEEKRSQNRNGGIDFKNARMSVRKEGGGVGMQFDSAMVERIRRKGFDGVEFTIESIVPAGNLSAFLGLN